MVATEQEAHEAFERLCGGPTRAFRLLRLYQNTYSRSAYDKLMGQGRSKVERFRTKAGNEGFADAEIEAFLEL